MCTRCGVRQLGTSACMRCRRSTGRRQSQWQCVALAMAHENDRSKHPAVLVHGTFEWSSSVQRANEVGSGGEAWIGYKQDLRPCQFGLMLSIEPSFSVFYQGKSVVDYAQAVLTKNARQPWQWTADQLTDKEAREVSKELKGLTVRSSRLLRVRVHVRT
jgi:Argonaute linker 1 domain